MHRLDQLAVASVSSSRGKRWLTSNVHTSDFPVKLAPVTIRQVDLGLIPSDAERKVPTNDFSLDAKRQPSASHCIADDRGVGVAKRLGSFCR